MRKKCESLIFLDFTGFMLVFLLVGGCYLVVKVRIRVVRKCIVR